MQTPTIAPRTAKPIIAGIFNIVIGSLCVTGALVIGIGFLVFMPVNLHTFGVPFWNGLAIALVSIPILVLGVVSIIGGIYGLQRRHWGWALAGSITTTLVSNVLGVAAIVLIAVSKDEFTQT